MSSQSLTATTTRARRVAPLAALLVALCATARASAGVLPLRPAGLALPAGAGADKVLWDFAGPTADGAYPDSSLIADASGTLYGVTSAGGRTVGRFSVGTAFVLTPQKKGYAEKVIWYFGAPGDGLYPSGSLVADGTGVLYGTTSEGGSHNYGTVYTLTPGASGYTETILYSFAAAGDGADPNGITLGSKGVLYGTAMTGGANNVGTVFELKPSKKKGYTFETLWSFGATPTDGTYPDATVTLDASGAIYGVTAAGGTSVCSCGTVFMLTKAAPGKGDTEIPLWSFSDSANDGAGPTAPVILDGHHIYTTTTEGGAGPCNNFGRTGCGVAFKLTSTSSGYDGSVMWSFGAQTGDGQAPNSGLISDGASGFFGTTVNGGAYASAGCNFQGSGCGTAFHLVPAGSSYAESVLASFGASASDGREPEGGLLAGPRSRLYGTTTYGGSGSACDGGCGTVFDLRTPRSPMR